MPPVESGELDAERAGPRPLENGPQPLPRKLRSIRIRFGHTLPSMEAVTLNLSERGLFVSTLTPMDAGAPIRLHLNAEAFSVPLRGVVVWNGWISLRALSLAPEAEDGGDGNAEGNGSHGGPGGGLLSRP